MRNFVTEEQLRQERTRKENPIPPRILHLERDRRGYPVPWNVVRGKNGEPLFTVNDSRKHILAIRRQLCPICGERLGRFKWFVGGPRSAFDPDGWYLDLPGHLECESYALSVCPYLSAPQYLRRIDVDLSKLPPETRGVVDDTMIPERPDLFVAVASDAMKIQPHADGLPYVRPARPLTGYQFWRQGRQIMEFEALPLLQAIFGAQWQPPVLRES